MIPFILDAKKLTQVKKTINAVDKNTKDKNSKKYLF